MSTMKQGNDTENFIIMHVNQILQYNKQHSYITYLNTNSEFRSPNGISHLTDIIIVIAANTVQAGF